MRNPNHVSEEKTKGLRGARNRCVAHFFLVCLAFVFAFTLPLDAMASQEDARGEIEKPLALDEKKSVAEWKNTVQAFGDFKKFCF